MKLRKKNLVENTQLTKNRIQNQTYITLFINNLYETEHPNHKRNAGQLKFIPQKNTTYIKNNRGERKFIKLGMYLLMFVRFNFNVSFFEYKQK
jgi:hypothetical protein